MTPRQSWSGWLDERLWDARQAARNAWREARSAWYRGADALEDLLTRQAPGAIRTLGDLLRASGRGYQQTVEQAPESIRSIRDMIEQLQANPPRPGEVQRPARKRR
jgi:hypothetical protein